MDELGRHARGRAWWRHALCVFWTLLTLAPATAGAQCIDEAIRDELNARRQYRGVQERLFQKARRHELSVLGGAYAADLMSSSYVVGGAYTFHFSEDLGLEASVGYTRSKSEVVSIIEDHLGTDLVREKVPVWLYQGHLIWTLAYGKLRWFGSRISRFDFGLALGGGVTDNQSARSLTFSGGLGLKFFPNEWFAVRIDLRDQVLTQELLGDARIVNNLMATLGLSVFIPFGF
ncbi:MAG: outer membrane beta-barrel domain-containing protein [Myxococcales bacterium]